MVLDLQPEVNEVFQEVLSFLNELNESTIPRPLIIKAAQLKQKIESVCPPQILIFEDTEELYDEATAEAPELPGRPLPSPATSTSSKGSIKRKSSSYGSYRSDEQEIAIVSVASLDNPTKHGHLEKKRPDSKLFNKTYQKRYCVIHEGIFYYFDGPTAKKQSGAFYLKEYEARPAYHLIKNPARKEGSFEMVAPGQRSYQFLASSFEEMKEWIGVVSEWSETKHPPSSSLIKPSDALDPSKNSNQSGSDSGITSEEHTDHVDSDLSSTAVKSVSPFAKRQQPPAPLEEIYDEAQAEAETEEVYDEAGPEANDGQEIYDEAEPTFPKPPPPIAQEEIYDELTQEEELYDDAEAAPVRPPLASSAMAKRSVPEPPSHSRPLPPPPPEVLKPIYAQSDDYSNMFYGIWDCETNIGHELNFNSGDVIHVVDKQHEAAGWWTGLLNGKVGLVPKAFLTPAYAAS